jgi:hypothetical protein
MNDTQASATPKQVYDPGSTMDPYLYDKHAGRFQKLLWYSAGADTQLLLQCPQSDRVKMEGIGGTVLATTILAFFSGWYAFYTVFVPKTGLTLTGPAATTDIRTAVIATFAALIWAAVIFNLDRFIVSSGGKGDGSEEVTPKELLYALPRILMACIIGFVLSKPLELKIMESEIKDKLKTVQRDRTTQLFNDAEMQFLEKKTIFEKEIDEAKARIQQREEEIAKQTKDVQAQRALVEREAEGSTGSGKSGRGPAWKDKRENLDKKEAELAEAKVIWEKESKQLDATISNAKASLADAQAKRDDERNNAERSAAETDGLMVRINIVHVNYFWSSLFLTGLLLMIEVTPIFFKMMLTKGPYDYLVDNQKEMVKAKWAIQELVQQDPSQPKELEKVSHFHRADTVRDYELGQLQVERALTKVAHEAFQDVHERKIKQEPEKYVQQADSVPRG